MKRDHATEVQQQYEVWSEIVPSLTSASRLGLLRALRATYRTAGLDLVVALGVPKEGSP